MRNSDAKGAISETSSGLRSKIASDCFRRGGRGVGLEKVKAVILVML